jgi:hypothetical protein
MPLPPSGSFAATSPSARLQRALGEER